VSVLREQLKSRVSLWTTNDLHRFVYRSSIPFIRTAPLLLLIHHPPSSSLMRSPLSSDFIYPHSNSSLKQSIHDSVGFSRPVPLRLRLNTMPCRKPIKLVNLNTFRNTNHASNDALLDSPVASLFDFSHHSSSFLQIQVFNSSASGSDLPVWDTGFVNSSSSVHIVYQGPSFTAFTTACWQVR